MDTLNKISRVLLYVGLLCVTLAVATSCGLAGEGLNKLINVDQPKKTERTSQEVSDYYNKFYNVVTKKARTRPGTTEIRAIDGLPKDSNNQPNWTAAVVNGMITPRGSLDPNAEEEEPFDMNIFFEAKVPLMANVLFPHSIHTYWLSCNVCHPKIFIPEAGANEVTMDEIFQGQWCGRCHGKVAFTFWPRANCTRCHSVLKGESLMKETWK